MIDYVQDVMTMLSMTKNIFYSTVVFFKGKEMFYFTKQIIKLKILTHYHLILKLYHF